MAPITLDSLTSGFNISFDITAAREFNEMMGFTNKELTEMFNSLQIPQSKQVILIPIMKENYDGYTFSVKGKEKIYNSNMCLYFLNNYVKYKEIPDELIDTNIASDYDKLAHMLDLCKGEEREKIIERTIAGETITSEITKKFNPAIEFTEKELVSMLFYLGYLTIKDSIADYPRLGIPNTVMKELYSDYFLEVLSHKHDLNISDNYSEIGAEIAIDGKIDKITQLLHKYLEGLSNRDFMNFDEKYVKLIFYCIAMNLKVFTVNSEIEINRKYPDLLLVPRDISKEYCSVMIEFKYLRKNEESMLGEKQKEARKQIEEYGSFDKIKAIPKLHKYIVIAVNDKIYTEEVK